MKGLYWRAWLERAARVWGSSLQLRTVVVTVLLTSLAAGVIGAYISFSVGTNLFDSRRDDLLVLSENATLAGQRVFDESAEQLPEDAEALIFAAADAILAAASSTPGTSFAIRSAPGTDRSGPPIDFQLRNFPTGVVSDELQNALRGSAERRTYSQSASLQQEDGAVDPGLIVGSTLVIDGANHELYLVYNLRDAQQTLSFVQQTLLVGGLALLLLIAAITWVVVRFVIGPVELAAETSRKLAAGDLEVRIPVRGDDVIATLARSFNGMAESLQNQITRLATLSQLQQRFVSDVSHELRTPLTTIRLAGDVLYDQRETFAPTTARTAELLRTQVQRFESLLADLLEMSRYDAGAVEMEPEPVSLVSLVEEELESVRSLADAKGSDLRLVAPGGYFEAEVDVRRIRRILQNLLGNAIDHGEGKPVVVWIDSDQDAVAIAVRDYGIGMTPAAVNRVFDRFWRADPSRQRTTGGTGLGLAIALEDAALHGGWLEVWSAPGEGSCFRLTLPREHGAELRGSPLPLPPDAEPPAREDDDV
jgi:two-component system sensor histidine kinase MtrB